MANDTTARLSACVVMYGGAEEVRRCIDTIVHHTSSDDFTLYLVDNVSPDGALQILQNEGLPSQVVALPQKENKGFGTGHNTVLPLLHSKYHAVINPDIEVNTDVLNQMADWMDAHPDVAIANPRLIFPDGSPQYTAKRRPALLPLIARQIPFSFLQKYNRHYLMLDEDLSAPVDVEFCSGSFFMIRTDIFRKIGGFDEGYFMYVEDADITQKALCHGRAMYLPQISVTHVWHRDAHRKTKQFLWQLRSMFRYFKKWGFRLS